MSIHPLPIIISPAAQNELQSVWQYNFERNGLTRANRYDEFLRNGIDKLTTTYKFGKVVEVRPDLRYVTVRRRSRGDGHVIVFRIGKAIEVLHVFHTKRDWPSKL
jgi:plasmid stabilization system protein ParE